MIASAIIRIPARSCENLRADSPDTNSYNRPVMVIRSVLARMATGATAASKHRATLQRARVMIVVATERARMP